MLTDINSSLFSGYHISFHDIYFFSLAAESAYQSIVAKKQEVEQRFLDQQASLDALFLQIEITSKTLEGVVKDEEEAKKVIEELPLRIERLEAKIEDASRLLSTPGNNT